MSQEHLATAKSREHLLLLQTGVIQKNETGQDDLQTPIEATQRKNIDLLTGADTLSLRIAQSIELDSILGVGRLVREIYRELLSIKSLPDPSNQHTEERSIPIKTEEVQLLLSIKPTVVDVYVTSKVRVEILIEAFSLLKESELEKYTATMQQLQAWNAIIEEFLPKIDRDDSLSQKMAEERIKQQETRRFFSKSEHLNQVFFQQQELRDQKEKTHAQLLAEKIRQRVIAVLLKNTDIETSQEKLEADAYEELLSTAVIVNELRIIERYRDKGIDLLELRTMVMSILSESKIKTEAEIKLSNKKIVELLTPVFNTTQELFPHESNDSATLLSAVLYSNSAVCAGKTEVLLSIFKIIGLQGRAAEVLETVSGEQNQHVMASAQLPGETVLYADANFQSFSNVFGLGKFNDKRRKVIRSSKQVSDPECTTLVYLSHVGSTAEEQLGEGFYAVERSGERVFYSTNHHNVHPVITHDAAAGVVASSTYNNLAGAIRGLSAESSQQALWHLHEAQKRSAAPILYYHEMFILRSQHKNGQISQGEFWHRAQECMNSIWLIDPENKIFSYDYTSQVFAQSDFLQQPEYAQLRDELKSFFSKILGPDRFRGMGGFSLLFNPEETEGGEDTVEKAMNYYEHAITQSKYSVYTVFEYADHLLKNQRISNKFPEEVRIEKIRKLLSDTLHENRLNLEALDSYYEYFEKDAASFGYSEIESIQIKIDILSKKIDAAPENKKDERRLSLLAFLQANLSAFTYVRVDLLGKIQLLSYSLEDSILEKDKILVYYANFYSVHGQDLFTNSRNSQEFAYKQTKKFFDQIDQKKLSSELLVLYNQTLVKLHTDFIDMENVPVENAFSVAHQSLNDSIEFLETNAASSSEEVRTKNSALLSDFLHSQALLLLQHEAMLIGEESAQKLFSNQDEFAKSVETYFEKAVAADSRNKFLHHDYAQFLLKKANTLGLTNAEARQKAYQQYKHLDTFIDTSTTSLNNIYAEYALFLTNNWQELGVVATEACSLITIIYGKLIHTDKKNYNQRREQFITFAMQNKNSLGLADGEEVLEQLMKLSRPSGVPDNEYDPHNRRFIETLWQYYLLLEIPPEIAVQQSQKGYEALLSKEGEEKDLDLHLSQIEFIKNNFQALGLNEKEVRERLKELYLECLTLFSTGYQPYEEYATFLLEYGQKDDSGNDEHSLPNIIENVYFEGFSKTYYHITLLSNYLRFALKHMNELGFAEPSDILKKVVLFCEKNQIVSLGNYASLLVDNGEKIGITRKDIATQAYAYHLEKIRDSQNVVEYPFSQFLQVLARFKKELDIENIFLETQSLIFKSVGGDQEKTNKAYVKALDQNSYFFSNDAHDQYILEMNTAYEESAFTDSTTTDLLTEYKKFLESNISSFENQKVLVTLKAIGEKLIEMEGNEEKHYVALAQLYASHAAELGLSQQESAHEQLKILQRFFAFDQKNDVETEMFIITVYIDFLQKNYRDLGFSITEAITEISHQFEEALSQFPTSLELNSSYAEFILDNWRAFGSSDEKTAVRVQELYEAALRTGDANSVLKSRHATFMHDYAKFLPPTTN